MHFWGGSIYVQASAQRHRRADAGACWALPPKPHTVPEETGHCRQSGGRRPGLGPEGPAEGWDWMGLGLGSAGRRPGLGLESLAEGRDCPGLGPESQAKDRNWPENRPNLVLDRPVFTCYGWSVAHCPLVCVVSAQYTLNTLSLMHIWHQNQCFDRSVTGLLWDWMGLGLDRAGRRPGLGLESQAEGQDWPGLGT